MPGLNVIYKLLFFAKPVASLKLAHVRKKFKTVVPNIFGTRDRFRGRQFSHGWGMVQVVM